MSSQRDWSFDDIPAALRIGFWSGRQVQTVGDRVTALPNRWPASGPDMVQAMGAAQPQFGSPEGYPAAIWPDEPNDVFLGPTAWFAPAWWIFVLRYRQGIDATWPVNAYSNLISTGETGGSAFGKRVMGAQSGSGWFQSDVWTGQSAVNAGPYAASVLPLRMGLMEVAGAPNRLPWAIGRASGASGRGWRGAIWAAMALAEAPTGALLARIQGRLAWDYGLQGNLPVGHPYRPAPPVIVTMTGGGALPGIGARGAMDAILPASGRGVLPPLAGQASADPLAPVGGTAGLPALAAAGRIDAVAPVWGNVILPPVVGHGDLEKLYLARGRVATAEHSRSWTRDPGTKETDVDHFLIKQRATAPALRREFVTVDGVMDLTGAVVTFSLSGYRGPVFTSRACRILDGAAVYYWQDGDTAEAGEYRGQFWITWPDGSTEGAPAPGVVEIRIERSYGRTPELGL